MGCSLIKRPYITRVLVHRTNCFCLCGRSITIRTAQTAQTHRIAFIELTLTIRFVDFLVEI